MTEILTLRQKTDLNLTETKSSILISKINRERRDNYVLKWNYKIFTEAKTY